LRALRLVQWRQDDPVLHLLKPLAEFGEQHHCGVRGHDLEGLSIIRALVPGLPRERPTRFRAALGHLSSLHLREPGGGIAADGTTVRRDSRIQLVGYGRSASTLGVNRAGRRAALSGFLPSPAPTA